MSTRGLKPSPYRVFLHECGRYPEKGGKRHDVPAHHRAAAALDAYVEAGRLEEPKVALFQTPVNRRPAGSTVWKSATRGATAPVSAHRLTT